MMNDDKYVPTLGTKLPEMEVTTTHGKMVLPNDLNGKWFVLFSHPADFAPVCTTEFVSLARYHDDFKAVNTELIGHSVGAIASHLKWTEWIRENLNQEITFPIVADSLGRIAIKLGMIHEAKGTDSVRAVFIIDDKGIIRTMLYYPQEAGRNIEEILRTVKSLQHSDKHNVRMPENWPNNEMFGDDVILPAATSEQAIKERRDEMKDRTDVDYKDWWFVSKPIDKED